MWRLLYLPICYNTRITLNCERVYLDIDKMIFFIYMVDFEMPKAYHLWLLLVLAYWTLMIHSNCTFCVNTVEYNNTVNNTL